MAASIYEELRQQPHRGKIHEYVPGGELEDIRSCRCSCLYMNSGLTMSAYQREYLCLVHLRAPPNSHRRHERSQSSTLPPSRSPKYNFYDNYNATRALTNSLHRHSSTQKGRKADTGRKGGMHQEQRNRRKVVRGKVLRRRSRVGRDMRVPTRIWRIIKRKPRPR